MFELFVFGDGFDQIELCCIFMFEDVFVQLLVEGVVVGYYEIICVGFGYVDCGIGCVSGFNVDLWWQVGWEYVFLFIYLQYMVRQVG